MSKIFEKNLHLWSLSYPKEAVRISYLDMRGLRKEQSEPIFGKTAPTPSKKSLVFFGAGLCQDFFQLENWLKENPARRMFFFEPDLRNIKKFLIQPEAERLLLSEQASLHPVTIEAIDFVCWASHKAPFELICHPYYAKREEKKFLQFQSEIHFRFMQKETLIEEFIDGGLAFFRNFYKNLAHLPSAKVANSFFGEFKSIPALLCGAGPSLQESIAPLCTVEEKALVLSGGSATSALALEGLRPHLAAVIDPNKTQISRIEAHQKEKIPHFFRLRLFWEALSLLQGEKIYVPGSSGYEVAKYFDEALSLEDPDIDEGYNVINFLLSLLAKMGANPIILVGVDLAFHKGSLYGATLEKNSILLPTEKQKESDFGDEVIFKPSVGKDKVATLYKWLYEADWISRFAKDHPEITLLRIGDGLAIPGVKPISWQELFSKTLTRQYPIQATIDKILATKSPPLSLQKIHEAKDRLHASLLACSKLLEELLILGEKAIHSHAPIDEQAMLLEERLVTEPAFSAIIDLFNQVFLALQGPRLRYLKMRQEKLSDDEMAWEKQKLQNERLAFLLSIIKHNLMLLEWGFSN